MLMILGCHIANWLQVPFLAQSLSCGVEVFLIISGYLYSLKKIDSVKKFLINRFIKLLIPVYIIVILLSIYYYNRCGLFFVIKNAVLHILNLQGLPFIFLGVNIPGYSELAQTWFLTVLVICYILMLFCKRIELKINKNISLRLFVIITLCLFLIDAAFLLGRIQLGYIIVFFIGYFWGKYCDTNQREKIEIKGEIVLSFIMLFSIGSRLFIRKYFDDTLLYNHFISIISHFFIAFWIFYTIQFFESIFPYIIEKITNNWIFIFFEKHNFYIYLTHYMFFYGVLNINQYNLSLTVKLLIMFMGTLILSIVLRFLTQIITNFNKK